jgi:YD repeat-containing protein
MQTVSKKGGPPVSYIWGYKYTYPIAEASNALYKNIYHQNFEETGGNSTLNDSKTGHYSHVGIFSKALSGLDNGDYVLSYWSKSGGVWTLNSSTITVSANTYTISLASGQYDDIRFYPVNALMTTATYDPNIGQTSATDAKSNITYYEYDTYQRLKNIKDKDGNIVKHIDYNYAH